MYPRRIYMSILYLPSLSGVLPAASALDPPTFKPSTSIAPSTDDILERPNPSSSTPTSLLNLNNTPLINPSNTTSSRGSTIIPIAGLLLRITHIVHERWFTSSILNTLMHSAHQSIREPLAWYPDQIIAPLPWFQKAYDAQWRDTLAVRVRGNEGKAITWLQLYWVLVGLQEFLEGDPVELHPVNFDISVGGEQGVVAAGVLWCSPGLTEDKGSRGPDGI